MNITVRFAGGTRFEVESEGHRITTDQPVEDGGTDAGMSPVQMFVGSLAGCIGYFVARYCLRHGINTDGFTMDVQWAMAERPHRVGAIEVTLHLATALTTSQQEQLLKVAHGCTVHQSLVVPPTIDIHVQKFPATSGVGLNA